MGQFTQCIANAQKALTLVLQQKAEGGEVLNSVRFVCQ